MYTYFKTKVFFILSYDLMTKALAQFLFFVNAVRHDERPSDLRRVETISRCGQNEVEMRKQLSR
jgi:hypothetical protein